MTRQFEDVYNQTQRHFQTRYTKPAPRVLSAVFDVPLSGSQKKRIVQTCAFKDPRTLLDRRQKTGGESSLQYDRRNEQRRRRCITERQWWLERRL